MTFSFNTPQPNQGNLPNLRMETQSLLQAPAREEGLLASQQSRAQRAALLPGELKKQQQEIEITDRKLEELKKIANDPDALTEQDLQQFEVLRKVFEPQLAAAAKSGDISAVNNFNKSIAKLPVFKKIFGEGFALDEVKGEYIPKVSQVDATRIIKNKQTKMDNLYAIEQDDSMVDYVEVNGEVIPIVPSLVKEKLGESVMNESTLHISTRKDLIRNASSFAKLHDSGTKALINLEKLADNPAALGLFLNQMVKLSGDVGQITENDRNAISGSKQFMRVIDRLNKKYIKDGTLPESDIQDLRDIVNGFVSSTQKAYEGAVNATVDSALIGVKLDSTIKTMEELRSVYRDPSGIIPLLKSSQEKQEAFGKPSPTTEPDVTAVKRFKDGRIRLSDGSVVSREEAKQRGLID